MKTIITLLITFFIASNFICEAKKNNEYDIDDAFEACLSLRNAIENKDSTAIKSAAQLLKKCNICDFADIRCEDDSVLSLNGHLLFDAEFADSLANGINVYDRLEEMYQQNILKHRGFKSNKKNQIYSKSIVLQAGIGAKTKYSFVADGNIDLYVVAEKRNCKFSLNVTAQNGCNKQKKKYNDTIKKKKGLSERKKKLNLSKDCKSIVEVEIINCTNKKFSVILMKSSN